jgi:hypothetical protein
VTNDLRRVVAAKCAHRTRWSARSQEQRTREDRFGKRSVLKKKRQRPCEWSEASDNKSLLGTRNRSRGRDIRRERHICASALIRRGIGHWRGQVQQREAKRYRKPGQETN